MTCIDSRQHDRVSVRSHRWRQLLKSIGKSCIWIYASGSGRIYCYEHWQTDLALAVGFVGGAYCSKRQSLVSSVHLVAGFLAGYLILLLKKIVRKTSGSTGKNCPSPSLSCIRHSDRGTCYDVCRRASNRSIEHGTEHSSYKHGWFQ